MPTFTAADTIRILIATDSHVGYAENDPVRKDDSWRSFDEVMRLAKDQDVDMVLLAGDLFHYSQPSRKSMYQVMRSLRMNCLGEKPCELELLSDANDIFDGSFNHVNYEDPDINVAIPVFSIHGNHDDPAGDGNYCALDLLQASGLVNYFGRTPEADRIQIKPVLLQKGQTKLALYGMSNVRDERLHLVWGHEHECLIDPTYNPETSFHVMQPGSSVATSLVPSEAVAKHVAIASITGREFKVQKIRLKSVRPFITKEVVLATDKRTKHLAKVKDNRNKLTKELMAIVDELIDQARAEWISLQDEPEEELDEIPLPLVRLKVEFTPPEGGNSTDVIQYHRKKASATRKSATEIDLPEEGTLAQVASFDDVKVELLVKEFLEKQSLQVLPTTPFGDAVGQFVDKDDRHAMELFVQKSLKAQVDELIKQANGADNDVGDEDEYLNAAMEKFRAQQEALAARSGNKSQKPVKKLKPKPRPADYDSDIDGDDDAPPAPPPKRGNGKNSTGFIISDDDSDDPFAEEDTRTASKKVPAKRASAKKPSAAPKKAPAKTTTTRSRKKAPEPEPSDDEDEDIVMEEVPKPKSQPKRAAVARGRQTQLNFSQASQALGRKSKLWN
ncbi:hypothetical protein DID88_007948 [Monilinia fructigena]|uniref:Double-strand break repair protein n=1 Tax=Monilinia fructigena TaxID=38457 RepID=A0A395J3V5_9HELO|nr:hypothetical protein DID88_007948 [Monilinia fructigena]